jgi:hypothetical protein
MPYAMRSILEKNNFKHAFDGTNHEFVSSFLMPILLAQLFRQRPQNHPCRSAIGPLEF